MAEEEHAARICALYAIGAYVVRFVPALTIIAGDASRKIAGMT